MNTVNDGGPAFPNVPSDPGYSQWDKGMSLRAWLAGKALAGILANPNVNPLEHGNKQVAELSVFFADATLAALETPK